MMNKLESQGSASPGQGTEPQQIVDENDKKSGQQAGNQPKAPGEAKLQMASTLQPKTRSATKATKAQQLVLIQYYIRLFCKHFGSFGRMKALNIEVRRLAEHRRYTDLRRFHGDYFRMYLELCERTTPYLAEQVRADLGRGAWAEYHWWSKCINLPNQLERRAMVRWVFENLAVREFENKAFTMALDESCKGGGWATGGRLRCVQRMSIQ